MVKLSHKVFNCNKPNLGVTVYSPKKVFNLFSYEYLTKIILFLYFAYGFV